MCETAPPLFTDEDKKVIPPLYSGEGLPDTERKVPFVLTNLENGWTYFILEGGPCNYGTQEEPLMGYTTFAIVAGFECECGDVPIEIPAETGYEREGLDYWYRQGSILKLPNHLSYAQLKMPGRALCDRAPF